LLPPRQSRGNSYFGLAKTRVEAEHVAGEILATASHVVLGDNQPRVALAVGLVELPVVALVLDLDDALERLKVSVDYEVPLIPASALANMARE
jgi:hypothetical protein